MLTLEDQSVARLEIVRDRPAGPQGPCAALAWALALYLVERYHPAGGLEFESAGRSAPGLADWYGVRIITPTGAGGLIRFWDAAVFAEGRESGGWDDLGRRFLEGDLDAAATLSALRGHLGLPERVEASRMPGPARWFFYLTLVRAGVDLLVDGRPVSLTRGLAWPDLLPVEQREPHPLRRAGVLGVRDAGAREWIGLAAGGSALYVHRRDGRLLHFRGVWHLTPAAGWLSDASWRIGQYLDECLSLPAGATPAG